MLPVMNDITVLTIARNRNYLVSKSNISYETNATQGMASLLTTRHGTELGYNASLEIMTDIYSLSLCSTIVGTASSQVYRVAVGISIAYNQLKSAIIMDHNQLEIASWTTHFLPLPEPFIDGRHL